MVSFCAPQVRDDARRADCTEPSDDTVAGHLCTGPGLCDPPGEENETYAAWNLSITQPGVVALSR